MRNDISPVPPAAVASGYLTRRQFPTQRHRDPGAAGSSSTPRGLSERTSFLTSPSPPASDDSLGPHTAPSEDLQLSPRHQYTVVLDMDETLIWHPSPGVVHKRAHVKELLEALKGKCELVLWTASTRSMGMPPLRCLDPKGEYFNRVIFRDASWFKDSRKQKYSKGLEYLKRPLDRVVIVENSPNSVRFNKDNAIIVSDFIPHGAGWRSNDRALAVLTGVLLDLIHSGRPVKDFLRTHEAVEEVALYRRNSYGLPLTDRPPGVFNYLKER